MLALHLCVCVCMRLRLSLSVCLYLYVSVFLSVPVPVPVPMCVRMCAREFVCALIYIYVFFGHPHYLYIRHPRRQPHTHTRRCSFVVELEELLLSLTHVYLYKFADGDYNVYAVMSLL